MSLRLLLGRAGTGKTRLCMEEIQQKLSENPQGPSLLYIVPEQATFQSEYALATHPGIKGIIRAQVLSFPRLAFKVRQEIGGGKGVYIDDTGKTMLLRKVLARCRQDLQIFKHSGEETGALENLVELFNEMKSSRVSIETLASNVGSGETPGRCQTSPDDGDSRVGSPRKREACPERQQGVEWVRSGTRSEEEGTGNDGTPGRSLSKEDRKNSRLQRKISDLTLIFKKMTEELSDKYLDAEDYLNFLADKIPQVAYLSEAEVWVDSFRSFNPQEMAVLEALLKHCSRVTVALTLDRDVDFSKAQNLTPYHALSTPSHLLSPTSHFSLSNLQFHPAALVCQQLKQQAAMLNLPVEVQILNPGNFSRFSSSPELNHLEENYYSSPIIPFSHPLTTASQQPLFSNQSVKQNVPLPSHLSITQPPTPNSQPPTPNPQPPTPKTQNLSLHAAPNRRSEVEALSRELISLVRDKGYRWRDMLIMTGALEEYKDILTTVFTDYEIPFFLDQKRSCLHHPLIEFLRSALEVITYNWYSDAVFRCARTDFLLPWEVGNLEVGGGRLEVGNWEMGGGRLEVGRRNGGEERGTRGEEKEYEAERWRERIYRLENYCLAAGIKGGRWLQKEAWEYRDKLEVGSERLEVGRETGSEERGTRGNGTEDEEEIYLKEINETRDIIRQPLLLFQKKMRAASDVKQKTTALYELLLDVKALSRLKAWREEDLKKGEVTRAQEHLQIYSKVLDLMDQMVEIMGEEKISLALYSRVLESGLDALRLSLVPPALDQVLVGTPDRTRAGPVKFAFILGANEGIFPGSLCEDNIFTAEERESLSEFGFSLAAGSWRSLLEEQYLVYMALTRASHSLWVSYSLADEEGKGLVPSLLISRLKELFPTLQEKNLSLELPVSAGEEEIISSLAHPRRTLADLAIQLGFWERKGENINHLWWDIYNWYAKHPDWQEQGQRLLAGIFYRNLEEPLKESTGRKLYGSNLQLSVSRLEKFRSCPFAQFVGYGLRLKERSVFSLGALDIGRFFHTALYNITQTLQEKKLDWGEVSQVEISELAEEAVERLIPLLQKEILLSSSRYRYLGEKLKSTVTQAAQFLCEHARASRFKPVGLEIAFGEGKTLPALTFSLANGCRVELVGRIDRLDVVQGENEKYYLRVIDYKSGVADLKINELYHGLSLQLLVYLEVALRGAASWLGGEVFPAGILYFRIHSPIINAENPLSPEEATVRMQQEYKMKGRVLANMEIVRCMDTKLEQGSSNIVPVSIKKDGQLGKGSRTLDLYQFSLLRQQVTKIVQESAVAITAGKTEIRPYRLGKKNACTYCRYKSVCQFDPLVEEETYRFLRQQDEERIFDLLAEGKYPSF